MDQTKRRVDFARIVAIVDAAIFFLAAILILRMEDFEWERMNSVILLLFLMGGVSLALSFFVSKSWYAAIGAIFWNYSRSYVLAFFQMFADFVSEEGVSYRTFSELHLSMTSLPLLAGVLGILSLCLTRKASLAATPQEAESWYEKRTRWSTFVLATVFYLMVAVNVGSYMFNTYYDYGYMGGYGYSFVSQSSSFLSVVLGFFGYVADLLEFDLDSMSCFVWLFSMLPTYLIYLGAQHPFGKKRNDGLIVLGIVSTIITAIFGCVMVCGEDGFASEDTAWLYVALILVSAIGLTVGYLWVSDKHSPAWVALFAWGFVLLVPLILLAVVVLATIKLMELSFKDTPSQSNGKTYTAKDENGEEYELTHYRDDLYKDDNGDYWRMNEDGESFERA